MRHLQLLRHAKSSWRDDALDDRDRPLSKRGRRAAEAIARRLAQEGAAFDLVLCSTALRTRQTLKPILAASEPRRVVFDRDLYLATPDQLLDYLRGLDDEVHSVLLIGHNPGLHELALALADDPSAAALPPLSGKFPAGARASFRFEGSWRSLDDRRAQVVSYVTPRDLAAADG